MTGKQRTLARILFVLYLIAVAWLCFGKFDSTHDVPRSFLGIPTDKVVHFLMFLPFPILAYLAFGRHREKWWSSVLWIFAAFLIGALLAGGTEIGQASLTTYRSGDPTDFLADLIALATGSVIVLAIDLWKQRK